MEIMVRQVVPVLHNQDLMVVMAELRMINQVVQVKQEVPVEMVEMGLAEMVLQEEVAEIVEPDKMIIRIPHVTGVMMMELTEEDQAEVQEE